VRIKPGHPAPALAAMQKSWNSLVADLPFQLNFLDESLDNFYGQKENGVISLDGLVAFLFFLPVLVCLDWPPRCTQQNKGNWHQESIGRFCNKYHWFVIKGFFETGNHRIADCFTIGLVFYA
jgi:hypothetical protein